MVVYDLAMKVKLDGEEGYRKLAKREDDKFIKDIFNILADNDKRHYEIINGILDHRPLYVHSNDLQIANTMFQKEEIHIDITKIKPEYKINYCKALKRSMDCEYMYKRFIDEIEDHELKFIFTKLREDEEKNSLVLQNLIKLMNNPEQWDECDLFKTI